MFIAYESNARSIVDYIDKKYFTTQDPEDETYYNKVNKEGGRVVKKENNRSWEEFETELNEDYKNSNWKFRNSITYVRGKTERT